MCSAQEKEELEVLKAWKQEAALAISSLQAQIGSLCSEVDLIKHSLKQRDSEVQALRSILRVPHSELYLNKQVLQCMQVQLNISFMIQISSSPREIMVESTLDGISREPPARSEADNPPPSHEHSFSYLNHTSTEQFKIGMLKRVISDGQKLIWNRSSQRQS